MACLSARSDKTYLSGIEILIDDSVAPIKADNERLLALFSLDITNRKQAQSPQLLLEQRQLQAQIEELKGLTSLKMTS